jgi:ABC-type transporter Mla MlaB component
METKSKTQAEESAAESLNQKKQEEKKQEEKENPTGKVVLPNIHLSEDKLGRTLKLSGVLCDGVQYYDLKNILYINSTGLANFIDLLKTLLKKGLSLRFVNVNDKIKEKIKSMGLDKVLNCS